MLKCFRKIITNGVPGGFENGCLKVYGVTVKKINYSKTVHGYNDDFSKNSTPLFQ